MTNLEKMAKMLRATSNGDAVGKAAVEAVFIALNQPGSVVRVSIDDVAHIEICKRITQALDMLFCIDWDKTMALVASGKNVLELVNESAVEFQIASTVKGFGEAKEIFRGELLNLFTRAIRH